MNSCVTKTYLSRLDCFDDWQQAVSQCYLSQNQCLEFHDLGLYFSIHINDTKFYILLQHNLSYKNL